MMFACPHCGHGLAAEAEIIGSQIACPSCSNTLTVPQPSAVADEVTSLTPSSPEKDQGLLTSTATKQRRLPVLALAAVIVVLAIGAAAVLFSRGKGGSPLNILASFGGPEPTE